jgi:hypothetical protein
MILSMADPRLIPNCWKRLEMSIPKKECFVKKTKKVSFYKIQPLLTKPEKDVFFFLSIN